MSGALSAAKAVLLAVKLAAEADIESLTALAAQHRGTLRKGSLILRILLTYLPETTRSRDYVPLVRRITSGELGDETGGRSVDITAVQALSDDDAAKKVRRLHLLPLAWPGAPVAREEDEDDEEEPLDDLTLFLVHRAHRVDEEAGLLSQVPELVLPFLNRTTSRDGDEDRPPEAADFLRTWTVSVLLPLLRRNVEYYPSDPVPHTLRAFEQLPDAVAITALLSRTGAAEEDLAFIGRDLKGMIGPWLYNPARWRDGQGRNGSDTADGKDYDADDTKDGSSDEHGPVCPGFERVLEWLTSQASGARTWRIAVRAIEQCDSPADADIDLGGYLSDDEAAPTVSHSPAYLGEAAREYVERRWARAALAAAYLVPEASVEALTGAHAIVARISGLLDDDGGDHTSSTLPVAASLLAPVLLPDLSSAGGDGALISARNATSMRTGLLLETNPLTTPRADAVRLAHALVLSAFLLTRAGCPCTVRRAAELVFLQPEREQREEAAKLLHAVAARGGAKGAGDDKYWLRVRNEILWLRDWGAEEADESAGSSPRSCNGVFGQIPREFLEVEMLKAMLNAKRYALARSLYEDASPQPLPTKTLQDTVFACAMNAYDNASNANRTRGGVLQCDDIIHAFPKTIEPALVASQRVEALLKATHSLSEYRLVLKQGEPFTPVILRVIPDPISIIEKVLEQNPKSYTRIQDLLDIGMNMVLAGLTVKDKTGISTLTPEQEPEQLSLAEHRVTAMCIHAALAEDDFETAYSYVVNRLANLAVPAAQSSQPASRAASLTPQSSFTSATSSAAAPSGRLPQTSSAATARPRRPIADDYSWRAALEAGKYRRTSRTVRPTHIGTAAADPEIRHLEQRLECLSTALRIAPASTLSEILAAFRRAEEELNAAVRRDELEALAWDERGDHADRAAMPGAFDALAPGGGGSGGGRRIAAGRPGSAGREAASPNQQHHAQQQKRRPRRDTGGAGDDTDAAPMSLFDLSRATALAARRNLGAVANLPRHAMALGGGSGGSSERQRHAAEDGEDKSRQDQQQRVRKRDQLRDAAVGTLVSGVGWLINAPAPSAQQRDDER